MTEFSVPDIIKKKRDGHELDKDEMSFFVHGAYSGHAHPSQIGAMLMAMYKSDLTDLETAQLTSCMVNSGTQLKWKGKVIDKHSTGGIGDKVSIPLVPALAALGFTVPMISGRGLGWTGGTLDKLESIPGFKVELTKQEMGDCLKENLSFIAATTRDICPADKILYKIRDITSTIDNNSLITGSILSKKIAAGVGYLVLDIKVGKGAFVTSVESAEKLAHKMISVSNNFDMKMRAVITRMEDPIGCTVGNALEIEESLDTLMGKGPEDLMQLVKHLGGELLEMAGEVNSVEEGKKRIEQVIRDGSALKIFHKMLKSQGVDSETASKLVQADYSPLPKSKHQTEILSETTGYISSIDGLSVGQVTWALGAGRSQPEQDIDHSVGVRIHKKPGHQVEKGQKIMTVYHSRPLTPQLIQKLKCSVKFSDKPTHQESIIIKSISAQKS